MAFLNINSSNLNLTQLFNQCLQSINLNPQNAEQISSIFKEQSTRLEMNKYTQQFGGNVQAASKVVEAENFLNDLDFATAALQSKKASLEAIVQQDPSQAYRLLMFNQSSSQYLQSLQPYYIKAKQTKDALIAQNTRSFGQNNVSSMLMSILMQVFSKFRFC